ncbi:uncharacterized protein TRAVEDRAFT_136007, partial [Trametes versicolor FP-101664 SS1]|uniref:uncharacterized protein n=1 Tax=Trametes versicolor (strain FP-101664) TaxID=717944 RepID=UPI0004621549
MRFGLLLVSTRTGQLYRRWPKKILYTTTWAKLETRADGGCVWCRLILDHVGHHRYHERFTITVRAASNTQDEDFDASIGLPLQHIIVKSSDVLQEGTPYLVYTEPEDPAASYIKTRSPIRDVGSPRALALARQHIDDCVHGHDLCKTSAYSSPRLPTRLVDCTDHARPLLVSTTGEHGEYVTLSYVWGGDQVHKTTTANLSSYEQGIAASLLPPTI